MKKTVYALGYFDGVHSGHRALLEACRTLAEKNNCHCGAVTFSGHPQNLLTGISVGLINTNDVRETLLRAEVSEVVFLPFDEHLMAMPWQDFCEMLIKEHHAGGFVCGSDFRFGKGGEGTAQCLASFCRDRELVCEILPQQTLSGIRVSSTHIRQLLEQGNIREANAFLGHPHMLAGIVGHGKQLGRTIGIPTANLPYPRELISLPHGVYACKAFTESGCYPALMNIGTRPTVSGKGITAECHLIDFSGDLYGKKLVVYFYDFLRPEHKFPDLSCLEKQVEKDKENLQNIIQNCTLHP